ncbi:hypothetical protein DVR14_14400 [Natrinema thermotolerans]|nr:hypothetical protein DVR14_14400 [Natrinema thermotolerans]
MWTRPLAASIRSLFLTRSFFPSDTSGGSIDRLRDRIATARETGSSIRSDGGDNTYVPNG